MEIYLIRHTTPAIEKGVVYGQLDVDVCPGAFDREARMVLGRLPREVDRVYTSPSIRTLKLAKLIAGEFRTDRRLMELNFGNWEGKKWGDINEKDLNHWMSDYVRNAPPGGESMLELQHRVLQFWNELITRKSAIIAVVSHAGVIRTLLAHRMNRALTSAFDLEVAYGSVHKMQL